MKFYFLFLFLRIFTIALHSQKNREQALIKDRWTCVLSGWVSRENFNISENVGDGNWDSKIDGYNIILSSRNGSLVKTNGVFVLIFNGAKEIVPKKPIGEPDNSSEETKEKE